MTNSRRKRFCETGPRISLPIVLLAGKKCIRVAVGECSVTECWPWELAYQTNKTVYMRMKNITYTEVMCLLWFPTQGLWVRQTSTDGIKKSQKSLILTFWQGQTKIKLLLEWF